ncbi:MAG: tetratricopeptide repeat protein [Rhodothermales bacterium]|nr:tetratricopeptide repeat protein [Rhodothermales bacterium]
MIFRYRHTRVLVGLLLAGLFASCSGTVEESEKVYSLGNEAFASLDFKRALLYFDEAIRLNPDNAEAYLKRGQIRWQSNQYEKSLPDLDRAIELDSTLTWAYFFRGVGLINLDQLEAALPDFTRVIDRNEFESEDIVRALTWRSIALFKLERYDESIADLSARVEREPLKVIHRIDRGGAYQSVGESEKAIADYRFAIETEGLDEDLRKILATRLLSLGIEVPDVAQNDSTTAAAND